MADEILTREELAKLLKVTERTIDRLRKEGLPWYRVGANVRFDKEKVLKWLEQNNKN